MNVLVTEPGATPELPRPVARGASDASFHLALLVLAAGVMVLSCTLNVVGEREVALPIVNIPLPGICTFQKWFGLDCPGCGLTRSFVSIGHGDLRAAWHFNPAGILGFLIVAIQVPYQIVQLMRIRRGWSELQLAWIGQILLGTFLVLLLTQWGVRWIIG